MPMFSSRSFIVSGLTFRMKKRRKACCAYPIISSSCSSFLPDVLKFLLHCLPSDQTASLSHSFRVGLLATNFLNFVSFENVLISSSFQNSIFTNIRFWVGSSFHLAPKEYYCDFL